MSVDPTGNGEIELEPREYALMAAEAAAEKKARDVTVIDVADLLVVTDYFVICTGDTDRQVAAIADEVESALKEAGLPPIGREGLDEGRWALLDFADVVVHVFQPDERDFYRLEHLWKGAPEMELSPEIVNASGPRGSADTRDEMTPAASADDVS